MNRSDRRVIVLQTAIVAATTATMLLILVFLCATFAAPAVSQAPAPAVAGKRTVTFDAMAPGKPPAGFSFAQTGGGAPCTWVVLDDATRPGGGRVLAQTSTDETGGRFPMCVLEGPPARDVALSVRFKPVAGSVDRAGGLVARYRDQDNYYVVRANSLEDNVRLYRVVAGKRIQFAGVDHKRVEENAWHTLRLEARGKHFRVWFDGAFLFEADDDAFSEAGLVGVWTKADSVTYFDDLEVAEPGAARAWDFENETSLPKGLAEAPIRGGRGGPAASQPSPAVEWLLGEDRTSPRGKTVLQMKQIPNAGFRAAGALLDDATVARDVAVSVWFKTLTGESEARLAGLVARYRDPDNCLSLRINTREDNVQLWRSVDGKRKQIGEIHHKLMAEGEWHVAKLEAKGTKILVFIDGQVAFEAVDDLLTGAGKAGIWGSPASLTYFDGLEVEALGAD